MRCAAARPTATWRDEDRGEVPCGDCLNSADSALDRLMGRLAPGLFAAEGTRWRTPRAVRLLERMRCLVDALLVRLVESDQVTDDYESDGSPGVDRYFGGCRGYGGYDS